jgi:hypothetical protein
MSRAADAGRRRVRGYKELDLKDLSSRQMPMLMSAIQQGKRIVPAMGQSRDPSQFREKCYAHSEAGGREMKSVCGIRRLVGGHDYVFGRDCPRCQDAPSLVEELRVLRSGLQPAGRSARRRRSLRRWRYPCGPSRPGRSRAGRSRAPAPFHPAGPPGGSPSGNAAFPARS